MLKANSTIEYKDKVYRNGDTVPDTIDRKQLEKWLVIGYIVGKLPAEKVKQAGKAAE